MRIRIIHAVPNADGYGRTAGEYLKQVLHAETELEFDGIGHGFPSIESELHGLFNGSEAVFCAMKAQDDGADGVFINCFDDPGVFACRELLRIPVYGGYHPAMLTALSLAERIAVITTDAAGVITEERKARQSGYDSRVKAIVAVEMGVGEFAGADSKALVNRVAEACAGLWEKDGVGAVVLGCTAMYKNIDALRARLRESECPVSVIEPLQNGVKYLEYIIEQRYSNALNVLKDTKGLEWY